ncbi:hypothetical protein V5735_03440 (plasmid) [Haladaptatus sp. SPP-AMP-3]|uniref:hypothetical protein n=1 Tax=Haladaptatus sp. SPP-AMP-3 TaxID=3121295 RepID=UPI003C2DB834
MTRHAHSESASRREQHVDKDTRSTRTCTVHLLVGLLAVLAVIAVPVGDSGVARAQTTNTTVNTTALNDTAPYYENQTAVRNRSSWFPNGSTVSLDTLGQMSLRLGSFVIGTGDQIPGGTTYAGTIITGILMVAVFLGAISYTNLGSTGGVVVAATIGYGMTSIGLAPPWLKIVLLMIIGSIAAVAALRVTR